MRPDTAVAITNLIDRLTVLNIPFTCYDITRLLKIEKIYADHSEVRAMVHDIYNNGNRLFGKYTRNSMVTLPKYNVTAEVFAPTGMNAAYYDPDYLMDYKNLYKRFEWDKDWGANKQFVAAPVVTTTTHPASTVSQPTQPQAQTTSAPGVKVIDDKRAIYPVGSRGRLTIGANFLRRMGLGPRSTAYIAKRSHGNGLVVLSEPTKSGHGNITKYTVDKSGNIRITRDVLARVQLGNIDKLKLRLADNSKAVVVVAP